MAVSRFFGADLAWSEGRDGRSPNESVLDLSGRVLDVGWTRGIAETAEWIESRAGTESALLFIDAPLVVSNATGQRPCETQVGQRYGRWKVSANTTDSPGHQLMAGKLGMLPVHDARGCSRVGLRRRTATVQAEASIAAHSGVAADAGCELRRTHPPTDPDRKSWPTPSAGFSPDHAETGQEAVTDR
jgi:hypothetical protein